MFVKVKKKQPKEYYRQLIRDFEACRNELDPERLRLAIALKNKKDERKKWNYIKYQKDKM